METTITELANIENFKRFLLDLTEKADELKAELIGVESGQLDRINGGQIKMKIQSKSNPQIFYEVSKSAKSCTCPDFKFRGHIRPCKHIKELLT